MAKFEKFGNYTVLNPTPKEVRAGVDMMSVNGAEYVFKPYEEKVVFVLDHVDHICNSSKHINKGLVFLNYGEEAQKQFATYEEYKKAKASEGLKRAIGQASLTVTYEQQAEKAAELGGFLIEKRSMNSKKHEAYLEKLETIQANLDASFVAKEEVEEVAVPEWMGGEAAKPVETPSTGLEVNKEYNINGNTIKKLKNGAYIVNSKMTSKQEAEKLLESWSNDN